MNARRLKALAVILCGAITLGACANKAETDSTANPPQNSSAPAPVTHGY